MNKSDKILITGGSGLIGSALIKLLHREGYNNLLTPTHNELDFISQVDTNTYFYNHRPDYVFHLASHVGGIQENKNNPAEFIYNNTAMQCHVFNACQQYQIIKLLFPGSACAYPANAPEAIPEQAFLQGPPEPTNLAYAIAKQNGIVMAQSFARQYRLNVVLPMVTNTYGPGDRSTHVIPQLIEKFKNATPEVKLLGDGTPLREFIHCDDVASAFLFLMLNYESPEIINVGTGEEISIRELVQLISNFIQPRSIVWDSTQPNGQPRKALNSEKLRSLGWKPTVSLREGLAQICA